MKKTLFILILFFTLIVVNYFISMGLRGKKIKTEIAIPRIYLEPTDIISNLEFSPGIVVFNSIFQDDHTWIATLSSQRIRTLIVTGDIIPARSVNFNTIRRNDFTWAFASTAAFLKSGDITFINLEAPLIKNCIPTVEGMFFCGDQRHIQGLLFSGIDIANFANNHMGNYGVDGVLQTARLLNDNGISVTGTGSAVIKNVRGKKFAFLGYNEIGSPEKLLSWIDYEKIKQDILLAREKADIVVVAFHWGVEYMDKPTEVQKKLAHFAIDAGADLIIGNHPHWIQPVGLYKNKFIAYAHGNFIFDQMWSQKTREGVVGKYTFFDNSLIDVEYFPVVIYDYGQPRFAIGNSRLEILQNMKNISL